MRSATLPVITAIAAAIAFGGNARSEPQPAVDSDRGVRAFGDVARVLQSPRCMNCHPAGDAPLNGDAAARHKMNVTRTSVAAGLACTTCHRNTNGPRAHMPPGAPHWQLPPPETPMVFQGKSPHDLCEQLKDPARNGKRSLVELRDHVAHDALVLWGWSPGPGRSLPPLTHDAFVAQFDAWIAAGAPCPTQ